jgi:hypothetical protein
VIVDRRAAIRARSLNLPRAVGGVSGTRGERR